VCFCRGEQTRRTSVTVPLEPAGAHFSPCSHNSSLLPPPMHVAQEVLSEEEDDDDELEAQYISVRPTQPFSPCLPPPQGLTPQKMSKKTKIPAYGQRQGYIPRTPEV
jgi:hypothetical protein